jgi:hypothetical protein
LISLGDAPTLGRQAPLPDDRAGSGAVSFELSGDLRVGTFPITALASRNSAWVSPPGFLTRPDALGQVAITLLEEGTRVVGGFALTGGGLTAPDLDYEKFEVRGEFVWTPGCLSAIEELNAIGAGVTEFLDERGLR